MRTLTNLLTPDESKSELPSTEAGANPAAPADNDADAAARAQTGVEAEARAGTGVEAAARPGVTADDVVACIEMVLGRTPDAPLVEYHLGLGFTDRFALGKYMINTDEFRVRFAGGTRHHRPAPVFLGDRVLAFTHRGHVIYLAPMDLDLTPRILLDGTWEPHIEQAIIASIRPGDTVIDVGANVGYHTLAIGDAVGPSGEVHAFEANPNVMRLLKATMFVNHFSNWRGSGRVALHESAVLDRPGTVTLASAPGHYGSGHVINDAPLSDYGPAYSTRVEVPAVTLDAALADHVAIVDLIHMDIEGSEPLALRGGRVLIERSPKIKIVTEWSIGMMSTRADVGEFVAWLVEREFRFWLIEPGAKLTILEPSVVLTLPHCDLFLSRENPPG